jgi:ligand-binding SRPBCC domain-containing protein
MKIYQLETEIWLPKPRDEVFEFFADPANLESLTPGWLRFEMITKMPGVIKKGIRLDYRLRVHGMPINWQSVISDWEPPYRFVDQQTRGPYRLWLHEHKFIEHSGGTLVGDKVEYSVPGGILVQKLIVAPDLDRIFKYRHMVLQTIFNPENKTARQSAS